VTLGKEMMRSILEKVAAVVVVAVAEEAVTEAEEARSDYVGNTKRC